MLRAKCFPAQMENWPAVDEEQFDYIKRIIDESDYFVVISAGMYGSTHPETGVSYTEMEYDYAVEAGKPIIRLLRKDPFKALTGDKSESTAAAKKKLKAFHKKLSTTRMVRFWEDPKELGNEVTLALIDMKESKPAVGWAKANEISEKDSRLKIAELGEENRLLREALSSYESKDFGPILDGLSGTLEIQEYKWSGMECDDFSPFDEKPNIKCIEIKDGLETFLYQPLGEPTQKLTSWVMKRICFGFLFSRDFKNAVQKGLSSSHPIGSIESRMLVPTDEHSLESLFMALEGAGLLVPGEPYGGMIGFLALREKSIYLRRTPWALSETFRRWIVRHGNEWIET
ncbi:hypothetical protein ROG8370_03202 [Roseovarius gaetbuli]|uniref:DUF4062 domain-containing protein n=1 Tax=Roseovarius gaetbuli TaxID=1356575 RepID=A0A1X7A217_9RHOB|nr:hypothetical protein ROG8370_03202 [Roseovarius gaetbuli]